MMNNNDNLNNNTLNSNLNNNNNFNNNTLNSNLNNNNNFNNNNNLNNNNLNNNNLNDEKDEKYEKIKDKVINVMSNITYQMTDPFNPHKEEQKERIINNTSEDIKKSLNIITNNIQETADAFGFTTEKRRREKEELKKKHDALFEKYANNNIPKETQQLWRNVNNEINNNNSNFKLLQTSLKRDIKKSWNLIKDSVIPTDHNNNNNNNNNNYNNNNYNNYNEKLIKSDVDDKTKKVWRNVNNEIKNNNKIGLSKIAKNAWNNIITEINSNKMVNSVESAKKVISNLSTSLKNLDVASVQASIQTSLNDTVQKAKNSLEIFNKDAHNNNINNNNNQPIVREDGTTLRLIPVSEKAQKVFSAGNNNSNSNSNNNEAGVAHLLSTQQPITPQPVEQTKTDVNNNDTMVNDTMVNDTMVNDINFDVRKQEINNNEAQERNL